MTMSTSESPTARDAARSYIRRGWKPIPVGFKSKRPTQPAGHLRRATEANLDIVFRNGEQMKVGVMQGGASDGLTVDQIDVVPFGMP
jgi:hypothetical protein